MIRYARAAAASLGLLISASALAEFPERPIVVTVPVPPAGIIDQVTRIITPAMSKRLGQTIVVENRPGASGNIAANSVARAHPDGYTLLSGYSMFHVGNPVMFKNIDWDPVRDFSPVAMLVVSPHVVAVHPSVPVSTLKEYVDYARSHPGKLNYATSGNGSVPHVGMELFKQTNQIQVVHVPYKGAGPAVQDVLAGNVESIVATLPSVASFIKAGKLRALAVASKTRSPLLPDVPTAAEAGFPGFELEAWVAFFAPAKTPQPVIDKLSAAVNDALKDPAVAKSLDAAGASPSYLSPADLARQVDADIARWQPVIRNANIKVD
ncbi:Bug family tripartite tricarboxylate transporter substrate binding protein [Bordetella genomosp. 13]|uniref:Bug family tripartite tricarboxylate transporter substrate binding protein n=1 Tax=Bordetella genomosp. 13 TaxID=463040 RepID=UPI00119D414A|nr:tripartite tricarboxylate transporter substrate binding protein [Bordetella genomosp. 13]